MISMRSACAALAVSICIQSQVFCAQSIILTTTQNPFNPDIANQGWWSSRFAQPDPFLGQYTDNYLTGLNVNGATYKSFFSFALPNPTKRISHAQIEIGLGTSASPDSYETLGLYDVMTSTETLNSKPGVLRLDILEDLGTGALYGTYDVPIGAPRETILQIQLNDLGVDAINARLGDFFSLGASLIDIDPSEGAQYIFGFTSSERGYVAKLVLHLVPEPSTLALLAFVLILPLRGDFSSICWEKLFRCN